MKLMNLFGNVGGLGNSILTQRPLLAIVLLTSAILSLALPAHAQTAPAGNSHPQREVLAASGEENPFGNAPAQTTMTVQQKYDFASKINLEPLRDLAVYHAGRVKILDSLARETVSDLTGRKSYYDTQAETSGDKTRYLKRTYDPLFTLIDVIIDPAYYQDKPLIGVGYVPLRQAFLERQYPGEAGKEQREVWMRLARLSPELIAKHFEQMGSALQLDQQLSRGLQDTHDGIQLYLNAPALLKMVPADAKDKPWLSLSKLPKDSAAAKAVADLSKAWRSGNAEGVNAAATVLARELPNLGPGIYPTTRRQVERVFNASSPFEWGMWLYAFSFLALILAFGTGRQWLKLLGTGLLIVAVLVHFVGFAARCYIAERYSIQNQFESMTGVSLFAALVGLGMMLTKRQLIFAAAAAGVGFLVLIAATQTAIPGQSINREAAILNTSVLLKYHVTTVLVSYGLISLGLIVSCFYLGTYYAAKWRGTSVTMAMPSGASVSATALGLEADAPTAGTARVLADLDRAQMTVLQLAFWTLGVGILLGAWWADHSWGRWWAFDPKETWALVTWIVYLIVVHVRIAMSGNRALATAWLSLAGFIAMLWCYFGVNLLLPGLHAYA